MRKIISLTGLFGLVLLTTSVFADVRGMLRDRANNTPITVGYVYLYAGGQVLSNSWVDSAGEFTLAPSFGVPIPTTGNCTIESWHWDYLVSRETVQCADSTVHLVLMDKKIVKVSNVQSAFNNGNVSWSFQLDRTNAGGKPLHFDLLSVVTSTAMTAFYTQYGVSEKINMTGSTKQITGGVTVPANFPEEGYVCVNFSVTLSSEPLKVIDQGGFCVYKNSSFNGKG